MKGASRAAGTRAREPQEGRGRETGTDPAGDETSEGEGRLRGGGETRARSHTDAMASLCGARTTVRNAEGLIVEVPRLLQSGP